MRKLHDKFLSGYIAVRALPGSPMYAGNDKEIIDKAVQEADIYKENGVDSLFLENDHDLPYIKTPLPKQAIKLLIKIAKKVRNNFNGPIGIQVLEANNIQALEIAVESDLDYLRVEGFVFAHIGGAGLIEGCAGELLREREKLGANHIKVFADVKKKHTSHSLTSDLDIVDEINQAQFFLADGIIITGKFSGKKPNTEDLIKAKKATKLPVIIGSGMSVDNIEECFPLADGFLVGSTFRKNGEFLEDIDTKRLKKFVKKINQLRDKL